MPRRTSSGAFVDTSVGLNQPLGVTGFSGGVPVISGPVALGSSSISALSVDALFAMNTSTPGTAMTAAIGNAGSETNPGFPGLTWNAPGTGFTVGAHQAGANLGAVAVRGGSTHAAGSLTFNNVAFDNSTGGQVFRFTFGSNSITNLSTLTCITFGQPPEPSNDKLYDMVLLDDNSGHYALLQLHAHQGAYELQIEGGYGPTSHSPTIAITPGGTYWCSLNSNQIAGTADLYVYDLTGTLVGHVTLAGLHTGSTAYSYCIGNNEFGVSTSTSFFQNGMLDWSAAANPLMWVTVPSIGQVAAVQALNQTADVPVTPAYSVPIGKGGWYQVIGYSNIVNVATTSSTLPQVGALWTDPDTAAVTNGVMGQLVSSNLAWSTSVSSCNSKYLRVAEGTTISWQTAGYASVGATAMKFNAYMRVYYLGA